MRKVLVTGGTGFVGRWMRETVPPALRVDFLNRNDYNSQIWRWQNWDAVVHLAPIAPTPVLEYAQVSRIRVLYASSGIVYHPENDCEYRDNKLHWEQECIDSGQDVVIARLFTFCGEGLDDNKAIVQFERAAKEGKPLRIWGDGSCVRSYMHGSELGRWMWAILFRGVTGEAYDVGSDEPTTLLELARRYSDNIVIEGGYDVMPVYLPPDTGKTKRLLE